MVHGLRSWEETGLRALSGLHFNQIGRGKVGVNAAPFSRLTPKKLRNFLPGGKVWSERVGRVGEV